jgi:PKD repeat protein
MNLNWSLSARFARTLCIALFAAAAGTLVGCGGGDKDSQAGTAGTASATPTADVVSGAPPLAVNFTAAAPKGTPASYQWDFKDNTPVAMGPSVQHMFMEAGMYAVTLTVKDAAGRASTSSLMVTVGGGASAAACATAPAEFATKVWPAMSSTCLLCHMSGRPAAGSGLVFAAGGTTEQNYSTLRTYANAKGDLLLSKTIGLPTHDGGKPFVDANSQEYKDLAALLPVMKQSCTTAPIPGPVMGQFWNGVGFISDATTLSKASILFTGRNPTAEEFAAVAAGGTPVLRTTIRGYMTGAPFDRFLNEVGDTHFLAPGVVVLGNNMGYNAADFPTAANIINNTNLAANERNRFQASARREGVELMRYIVNTDKSWTDMVAGNYTMVNGILAQYLGATTQGTFVDPANDSEWLPATIPSQRLGGVREHAGVLSTQGWLQRFPTTPTNRNRHRVYIMAKQFLATDVTALAARPLDDVASFIVPTVENPACAVCHDTIDPMAAGFQNWNEANRYLPQRTAAGVNHALPNSYRSTAYPNDAAGREFYQNGDNWFRDSKAPGYAGTPMPGGFTGNPTALQWLGQQVAMDSRYALGATHFWYEGVFGRAALKAPFDTTSAQYANLLSAYNAQNEELQEIAARFKTNRGNGAYNVKDLLTDLVMSKWFRAERVTGLNAGRMLELHDVGSYNLLTPSQLQTKFVSLLGQPWADFNNPYAGNGVNYGNFNGVDRITRQKEYTMMQATVMDRFVATRSCAITQADFNKTAATRLLFANVAMTDTPATPAGLDAITQNVRYLHKVLWKEDVPTTDAEVQRTVKLFTDVWADRATAPARPTTCAYNNTNDPNYTGRAWAAVIAYMVEDAKFLYE